MNIWGKILIVLLATIPAAGVFNSVDNGVIDGWTFVWLILLSLVQRVGGYIEGILDERSGMWK